MSVNDSDVEERKEDVISSGVASESEVSSHDLSMQSVEETKSGRRGKQRGG